MNGKITDKDHTSPRYHPIITPTAKAFGAFLEALELDINIMSVTPLAPSYCSATADFASQVRFGV